MQNCQRSVQRLAAVSLTGRNERRVRPEPDRAVRQRRRGGVRLQISRQRRQRPCHNGKATIMTARMLCVGLKDDRAVPQGLPQTGNMC